MLDMLERYFPPEAYWTRPQGGLFLWVRLPESIDTTKLLETAVAHKVAYVPGTAFYPYEGGSHSFRLNFSNASSEQIETGMRRLGEVIAAEVQKQSRRAPVTV